MKVGHVEIRVRKYADGRWGFDDYSRGRRRKVRLNSKVKADSRATDVAVLLSNGRDDLLAINRAELAEFRQWKAAAVSGRPLSEIVTEFLALKRCKSSRHFRSIAGDLRLFEEFVGGNLLVGSIMAPGIQRFIDSRGAGERRQFNLRASVASLFRWGRRMSYLPDRTTEAERVEPISRGFGAPNVLSPDQMRTLLANVRAEFLPWLVIAGFAGIRSEEIAPDPKSRKSPLLWEDFDWKHQIVIVRAETAKTGEKRQVPLLQNLAQWLAGFRSSATGRICTTQPSKSETARLGKFIGGWKNNALRDSFCSYRARITRNLPQVSYEMGNSIAMVKRSYHETQPIATAREWFNIRPDKTSNLVAFPKSSKKLQNSIAKRG